MKKVLNIVVASLMIASIIGNILLYTTNKENNKEFNQVKTELAEIKDTLSEKETDLEEANTNITELEDTVSDLQSQIEELNNQLAETEKQHEAELESIKKDTEVKEETKVVEQQQAAPTTPSTPSTPATPAFPDMSGLGGVISTTRGLIDLGEYDTSGISGGMEDVVIY